MGGLSKECVITTAIGTSIGWSRHLQEVYIFQKVALRDSLYMIHPYMRLSIPGEKKEHAVGSVRQSVVTVKN